MPAAGFFVLIANQLDFTVLRAVYMSAVSVRYLLMEDEGFRLNQNVSYIVGIAFALACFSV